MPGRAKCCGVLVRGPSGRWKNIHPRQVSRDGSIGRIADPACSHAFAKPRGFPSIAGLAILAILAGGIAFAQGGPIVNGPSQILNQYQSVRSTWLGVAAGYANRLFAILALIEFAWTGMVLLLDKTDLQGWTSALIRRMMFVGAFFALLQFGTTWIPAVIDSFVDVGQAASGIQGLSPSNILARGLQITGKLLVGAAQSGWLAAFGTALCMVFAALVSFLAFLGLSIQFVVATVESYLVIGAGFLVLGFGGSRWTAPYVERYIAYAVSAGVKIMIIYLLIGAGYILSATWVTAAQNIAVSTEPATDALDIAAAAVILLMICWNAPKLAAAILGGSPALTGGDAVATGGALLGGAIAVAGLAAGGVALGAKMLAARGGAMAVSQAASMGAGGTGGAGLAGGARGGAGASAAVPAGHAGSGSNAWTGGGQPSPPSSKASSDAPATSSGTGGGGESSSQPGPPSAQANLGGTAVSTASHESASDSPAGGSRPSQPTSVPPSVEVSSGSKAARRAAIADAVARATVRGGMAVEQLRNAIPSDRAPHVPPPPLNTETQES